MSLSFEPGDLAKGGGESLDACGGGLRGDSETGVELFLSGGVGGSARRGLA
jgi:hypothetical protein